MRCLQQTALLVVMSSEVHHIIAVELGFPEKIVKRALKKYKFKSAGEFVDYLELNEDEFVADEELDVEPIPGENKITIIPFPEGEQVVKAEVTSTATAKPEKTLREETEDLYRRSVCLNCFSRKRCIVTLPCSHFAICDQCEKRIKKCPLNDCCEEIECSITTYL